MSLVPPPRDRRPAFDRRDHTPRLWERDGTPGTYRRRIHLRSGDEGRVTGELEDDFHHFRVELRHDGAEIIAVTGSGLRAPWTTCLSAGDPLQTLVGTRLQTGPAALGDLDARQNCTHMFDLAGLLVAHGGRRSAGDRVYDMAVDDTDPASGERFARLWRDGEALLEWRLRDREVLAPDEWRDAPLWSGFIAWAAASLDDELAEAAVALRRTITISMGRLDDLDRMETAAPLRPLMEGICHTMQEAHVELAVRHKGSARDFSDRPELLLADFDDR